ncbi:molybdenum cofactor biosynthesis protein MoaE [Pedobacter sp. SD-b]|uniref:Molybdopterin synthase catalytic subunit n=1 Tax=Pedobacter segetis TaxID=2793069 RepID=A0ABS1BNJ9_9SPHI|nr:molybdenum cofactor biosynthesis protein MoaE [Pedobacter segetis]MBK0384468.1 molybdenum cofactor biosynthesis protein MoaE [Pedobacter segetis]
MEHIKSEKIDVQELVSNFEEENAGAVVIFNGTVRKRSLGKEVSYLFYEAAEEMAEKMMEQIILDAKKKWDLCQVLAFHRIGKVAIGESAVLVITASAHRNEAYEANRFVIEKIKHELPLWKCEYFTDGEKKWGGNCNCHEVTNDVNVHIYP